MVFPSKFAWEKGLICLFPFPDNTVNTKDKWFLALHPLIRMISLMIGAKFGVMQELSEDGLSVHITLFKVTLSFRIARSSSVFFKKDAFGTYSPSMRMTNSEVPSSMRESKVNKIYAWCIMDSANIRQNGITTKPVVFSANIRVLLTDVTSSNNQPTVLN